MTFTAVTDINIVGGSSDAAIGVAQVALSPEAFAIHSASQNVTNDSLPAIVRDGQDLSV